MNFINFSNHPSENWSQAQLDAAQVIGTIIDVPFPAVEAAEDEAYIRSVAYDCVETILELEPAAVLCQGEFNVTFAVVKKLLDLGVPVYSACSQRNAREELMPDGTVTKLVTFDFVRFRRYVSLE